MADERIYQSKQHSIELDTIENTCDVMSSNSSEEIAEHVIDKSKDTLQCIESEEKSNECKVIIHNGSSDDEFNPDKQQWSTKATSGDVVCLGAIFIILIIQLSILTFFVFKEYGFYES